MGCMESGAVGREGGNYEQTKGRERTSKPASSMRLSMVSLYLRAWFFMMATVRVMRIRGSSVVGVLEPDI